jgi:hypothetical protein
MAFLRTVGKGGTGVNDNGRGGGGGGSSCAGGVDADELAQFTATTVPSHSTS